MNTNFRNLALWVIVALLLVALFNLFQNPGQNSSGSEIKFSTFIDSVEQGQVTEVTISDLVPDAVVYRCMDILHAANARLQR